MVETRVLDDGRVSVTFKWSTENGECYDCGLPAAFYRDGSTAVHNRLCAVCAANDAAQGTPIARIGAS